MQREQRNSRCFVVSCSSLSVMASRSARPRLRAANIDLWVMTGRPSMMLWAWWATDGEIRLFRVGFIARPLGGLLFCVIIVGGVVDESEEWVLLLATKVPLRVAVRRSRLVLEASCSRLAA